MATYYVKTGGDDAKDGLSDANAWASLTKLNATTFSAGDIIKLNRGDTWTGQWTVLGNGASGNPITITNYGTGNLPVINANSANSYAIYINAKTWITVNGVHGMNGTLRNFNTNGTVTGTKFLNCTSTGGVRSFHLNTGTGLAIEGCTINQGTAEGLVTAATATGCSIKNNVFNGVAGKSYTRMMTVQGSQSVADSNISLGWNLTGAATDYLFYFLNLDGSVIKDNYAENSNGNLFYISGCTNTTMSGTNRVSGSLGGYDFYFNGGSGFTIDTIQSDNSGGTAVHFHIVGGTNSAKSVVVTNSASAAIELRGTPISIDSVSVDTTQTFYGLNILEAQSVVTIGTLNIQNTAADGVIVQGGATLTVTNGGDIGHCGTDGISSGKPEVDALEAVNTVTLSYVSAHHSGGSAAPMDGDGFTSHNQSVLNLYYCIGYKNKKSGFAAAQNSSGKVWNCTFYDNYDATTEDDYGIRIAATGTWDIKNNITKNHRSEVNVTAAAIAGGLTLTMDYNLFDDSRGGNAFVWGDVAYNFADYQTASGQDAHSLNADPLFKDVAASDFRLTFQSPAIDAGVDVSLRLDYEGKVVPLNGVPDIGAFEWYPQVFHSDTGGASTVLRAFYSQSFGAGVFRK